MKRDNSHNQILNSLKGIKRAQPKEELFEKIKYQLNIPSKNKQGRLLSIYSIRVAAACGLLLFFINIWSINNHFNKKQAKISNQDNLQSPQLIFSKNVYGL